MQQLIVGTQPKTLRRFEKNDKSKKKYSITPQHKKISNFDTNTKNRSRSRTPTPTRDEQKRSRAKNTKEPINKDKITRKSPPKFAFVMLKN